MVTLWSLTRSLNAIRCLIQRGHSLLDAGKRSDGRDCLALALAQAQAAGIESPALVWGNAVAADLCGDFEAALSYIVRAVRMDPLSMQIQHSVGVIAARAREALADADWAESDPATPRLYERLIELGEADAASHVAMANYHGACGKLDEAFALLEATCLLFPTSAAAWNAKADFLNAIRDEAGAREARACAAAVEDPRRCPTVPVPIGRA